MTDQKKPRKAYVSRKLNETQAAQLNRIAAYIAANGCFPSFQYLAREEKISSPSAFSRVQTLVKLGYIAKEPNGRGYRLVESSFQSGSNEIVLPKVNADSDKRELLSKDHRSLKNVSPKKETDSEGSSFIPAIQKAPSASVPRPVGEVVSIPILGWVQAGTPFEADNCPVGEIFIDRSLADPNRCYALQAEGESMIGIGIEPGDILIVRKQCVANSGEIVVAFVDNGLTVKTLYNDGRGTIELRPENEHMSKIEIGPETNLQILGVVASWMKYAQKGCVRPF